MRSESRAKHEAAHGLRAVIFSPACRANPCLPALPLTHPAWTPLEPSLGPYVGLLLVAVLIQELARVGIWRFHK